MINQHNADKGDCFVVYHVRTKNIARKTVCRANGHLTKFSINTQVIIQNRALSLARYLGLSADNHLDRQNGRQ